MSYLPISLEAFEKVQQMKILIELLELTTNYINTYKYNKVIMDLTSF